MAKVEQCSIINTFVEEKCLPGRWEMSILVFNNCSTSELCVLQHTTLAYRSQKRLPNIFGTLIWTVWVRFAILDRRLMWDCCKWRVKSFNNFQDVQELTLAHTDVEYDLKKRKRVNSVNQIFLVCGVFQASLLIERLCVDTRVCIKINEPDLHSSTIHFLLLHCFFCFTHYWGWGFLFVFLSVAFVPRWVFVAISNLDQTGSCVSLGASRWKPNHDVQLKQTWISERLWPPGSDVMKATETAALFLVEALSRRPDQEAPGQ